VLGPALVDEIGGALRYARGFFDVRDGAKRSAEKGPLSRVGEIA
jgi:hypothetical protein